MTLHAIMEYRWSEDTKCTCVLNLTPRPSRADIRHGWMNTSAPLTAHGVLCKYYTFLPIQQDARSAPVPVWMLWDLKHGSSKPQLTLTTPIRLLRHEKNNLRNSSHYWDHVTTGLHHLRTLLMIHSNSEWSTSPHEAVSGSWSINFAHNLFRSSQPRILTCVVLYVIYLEAFYAWIYNRNRHGYSFGHTIVLSTIQIRGFTTICAHTSHTTLCYLLL